MQGACHSTWHTAWAPGQLVTTVTAFSALTAEKRIRNYSNQLRSLRATCVFITVSTKAGISTLIPRKEETAFQNEGTKPEAKTEAPAAQGPMSINGKSQAALGPQSLLCPLPPICKRDSSTKQRLRDGLSCVQGWQEGHRPSAVTRMWRLTGPCHLKSRPLPIA